MKNRLLFLFVCLPIVGLARVSVVDSIVGTAAYPGTVHYYEVVVPDAYQDSVAAGLYVGLDGRLCNAPAAIDSLIAAGVMPPTVQVYLQSGLIKGADGHVVRYNRSNEFDATDSRFADFLAEEVLPRVDGLVLDDGRTVRLSADPARRCIFGLSSGGIAAFTAAFHRPDLFGMVFSGCGTFVPMRGGDSWPAIVRKHEPRPIKVFLQDGFSDTWNPVFGSWYEANRLLASALEFAGYDCRFDWAEGGHSVRRSTEIFPEVMAWLWAGPAVPQPAGNTFLVERLVDGCWWTACEDAPEGAPAEAVYPDSAFAVDCPAPGGWLWQHVLDADGNRHHSQRFYWLHSFDNRPATAASMAFDSDGWLWTLTQAGVQVFDQNGRVRGILPLPQGFAPEALAIGEGALFLVGDGGAMRRRMRISPAVPGVRPASQGQG